LISNPLVFRQNTSSFWGNNEPLCRIASFLLVGVSLAPIGSHVARRRAASLRLLYESSRTERQWEEKLRAIPSPDNLRAYMQKLFGHPHHVGSQADKANAEWIAVEV